MELEKRVSGGGIGNGGVVEEVVMMGIHEEINDEVMEVKAEGKNR